MGKTNNRVLIALLVVLSMALIVMVYINFQLSFKAHNREINLILVNEDLESIVEVLKIQQIKFKDFQSVPDSLKRFEVDKTNNIIRFQIINITFDDQGKIKKLSH